MVDELKKLLPEIQTVVPLLRQKTDNEMHGPCPKCGGEDRFTLKNCKFFCRQCKTLEANGGHWYDVIDFHCWLEGTDIAGLNAKYLTGHSRQPAQFKKKSGTVKARRVHVYHGENGAPIYRKTISIYQDGSKKAVFERYEDGKWLFKLAGVKQTLYNLPGLKKPGTVFLSESEKDAETLAKQGLVASSFGGAENWKAEYADLLSGREVIILEHNDPPGHRAAERVEHDLKAKGCKVLIIPGATWGEHKGADVADWFLAGHTLEELQLHASGLESEKPIGVHPNRPGDESAWTRARQLFPRVAYPWQILPASITASLHQMGRAFATSPEPLPGAACAIVASLLGSTIAVSPKTSWKEPLILWLADIRPSGSGKTPATRALAEYLHKAQSKADALYEIELADWEMITLKERGSQPKRPRGYFMTGLTLEGIRADHSGHGGTIAILDEVSALVNSQGEYKGGNGSDREAWLMLHDGKAARIVRASGSKTIENSRLNIIGGTQLMVWTKTFGGKDSVYTEDGTAFRLLVTYGGEQFHPLTAETWDEFHRQSWEALLERVHDWANEQENTRVLCISQEAQELFFNWRNDLWSFKPQMPPTLRGFIPKAAGYALRLAGVLHCLHAFEALMEPSMLLELEDMQRGIHAMNFYLGQIVDAAYALVSSEAVQIEEFTPQVLRLAKVLAELRPEVDKGHLAIGLIHDRFKEVCPPELRNITSRMIGNMLRHAGLTLPSQRKRCNGRVGAYCLLWDENTDSLVSKVQHPQHIHEASMQANLQKMPMFNNLQHLQRNTTKENGLDGYAVEYVEDKDSTFNTINLHERRTREGVEHVEGLFGIPDDNNNLSHKADYVDL